VALLKVQVGEKVSSALDSCLDILPCNAGSLILLSGE